MLRRAGRTKHADNSSARSDTVTKQGEGHGRKYKPPKGLPTAQEVMEKLALAEAEKASGSAQACRGRSRKKGADRQAHQAVRVSDEEALKRVATIIERAVANGLTEVQVYRFPNSLCTDHGRAINQQEPGWETTLTGVPKEMYEFWDRQLRPLGYKLKVQIIDFPGGNAGRCGHHPEMGVSR